MNIQEVHEQLLQIALRHKETNPSFTFSSRKKMDSNGRFAAGYWFRGNNNYVFFSPYKKSDWRNKTQTIGYAINYKNDAIKSIHISVVFGADDNLKHKEFYYKVLEILGVQGIDGKIRYKKNFLSKDIKTTFLDFLNNYIPKIDLLIKDYGLEDDFFVTNDEFEKFQEMIGKIKSEGLQKVANNVSDSLDEESSFWIFQGNPDVFNVEQYLSSAGTVTWTVSRYKNEISEGDKVLFWKSGENAGVYAEGEIVAPPSVKIKGDAKGLWYNQSDLDKSEEIEKCKIKITKQFLEDPILKTEIQKNKNLSKISIIKSPQGTNFKITEDEYNKILSLSNNEETAERNVIFYGPPGTGKTYHTLYQALSIIEGVSINKLKEKKLEELKSKYDQYKSKGQICFTTFHQSFSYEDFVEGIKPVVDGSGNITYSDEPGVLSIIASEAEKNWRNSLQKGKAGFDELWEELISGLEEEEEFIVIPTSKGEFKIYEVNNKTIRFEKNNGSRKHTLSINSLRRFYGQPKDMDSLGGLKTYYKAIFDKLKDMEENFVGNHETLKNYVLIIDEINRGNISKIFGELITLMENDKRLGMRNELSVMLPYSKEEFGVPSNLFLIGTMNTADRSIALLDTALRRRFKFIEVMPDCDLLDEFIDASMPVSVSSMLTTINNRIEYLYDRDHTIGHAYFLNVQTKDDLDDVMRNKIIPLLQEYFYDDWEKIQIVLGDHYKQFSGIRNEAKDMDTGINKFRFIQSRTALEKTIFGFDYNELSDSHAAYRINSDFDILSYQKIYTQSVYMEIVEKLTNE